jgi:PAS domain S-box-containing protein
MKDEKRTKTQLIGELMELRRRVAGVEKLAAERTRIAAALEKREEFTATLLDNAPNPILVLSPDTSIRYVNPAMEKLTGFSKAELVGTKPPYPWWTAETLAKTQKDFEEALVKGKGAYKLEELFQTKAGERFWVELSSTLVRRDGKARYYLSNWVDITKRKQAEEKIEHLNAVLCAIRNVNRLITKEKDRDTLLQAVCDSLVETRGYYNAWIVLLDETGELIASARSGLSKEFLQMLERFKRGELTHCSGRALERPGVVVIRNPRSTCSDCPLSATYGNRGAMTVRLECNGKVYGLLATSVPVHFIGEAEELELFAEMAADIAFALQSMEREEELRIYGRIISTVQDPMSFLDDSYVYRTVNEAYATVYNRAQEEIVGQSVAEFLGEDVFQERIKDHLDRCLSGEEVRYQDWFDFPDGKRRFMDMRYYPLLDAGGSILGVVSNAREITELKQAEDALRESEEKFRTAFNTAAVGMSLVENNGYFLKVNRTLREILGYSEQELLEKTWVEITSPDDLEGCYEWLKEVKGGAAGTYEKRFIHKLGHTVWVMVSASMVPDPNGKPLYYVALFQDITERKLAEQKLHVYQEQLRSLASKLLFAEEREKRRLATDLHDSIGQYLAISKIKMDVLCTAPPADPVYQELKVVRDYIVRAMRQTRSLTYELSPTVLYELGLEAALEYLAKRTEKLHGIATEFRDDNQPKPLGEDLRILLFRAVQELLVNIAKHARAQKATISVDRDHDHARITVEDDGIGCDVSEIGAALNSAGKFGLFSIKERLYHVGGRIELRSRSGQGTRVSLVAPLESP